MALVVKVQDVEKYVYMRGAWALMIALIMLGPVAGYYESVTLLNEQEPAWIHVLTTSVWSAFIALFLGSVGGGRYSMSPFAFYKQYWLRNVYKGYSVLYMEYPTEGLIAQVVHGRFVNGRDREAPSIEIRLGGWGRRFARFWRPTNWNSDYFSPNLISERHHEYRTHRVRCEDFYGSWVQFSVVEMLRLGTYLNEKKESYLRVRELTDELITLTKKYREKSVETEQLWTARNDLLRDCDELRAELERKKRMRP